MHKLAPGHFAVTPSNKSTLFRIGCFTLPLEIDVLGKIMPSCPWCSIILSFIRVWYRFVSLYFVLFQGFITWIYRLNVIMMSFIDSNITNVISSIKLNKKFILNIKSTHLFVLPHDTEYMTLCFGQGTWDLPLVSPWLLMATWPWRTKSWNLSGSSYVYSCVWWNGWIISDPKMSFKL